MKNKTQEMENQGTKRKEPIDKPIQREDKDKEIKIWAWKRFCFHSQGLPVLCSKLVELYLDKAMKDYNKQGIEREM